jgi:flagellar basal-body rod protein FlgG
MERGSYVSASGGLVQLRRLEVVNNNLANVNTPGFKRQMIVNDVSAFDKTLAGAEANSAPFAKEDHDRAPAVANARAITDFSQGPIRNTGNSLDVAINREKEFFVVNGPSGREYTRAGNFTLNAEGELVTQDGAQVLGDGGAITVTGSGANISPSGAIRAGGVDVGRLQVVRIEDPQSLERLGNARFRLPESQPAPVAVDPDLTSQSLEMSNTSAISSIVELIQTQRGFQMYTKTAETISAMNQSAINQVGKRNS